MEFYMMLEMDLEGLLQIAPNANILDLINSGVSLINYIGHGSPTTLADEKIIDMDRDLNQICPKAHPVLTENPYLASGYLFFG